MSLQVTWCESWLMTPYGCWPDTITDISLPSTSASRDNTHTWITNQSGSIKVTFKEKTMIKHFILKTSEWPTRDDMGLVLKKKFNNSITAAPNLRI